MAWDLPPVVTLATDRTAAYFNKYKSCFDVLDQHVHTGATGDGDDAALAGKYSNIPSRPALIALPNAGGNFTLQLGSYGGWLENLSHALNDQVEFDLVFRNGNQKLNVLFAVSTDAGEATLYIDGGSVKFADLYWGSTEKLSEFSVTVAPGAGLHTLRIKVTGRNLNIGVGTSTYKAKIYGIYFSP